MNETIRVHVVKYPNRPNLVLRYFDKSTGKQVAKSAGTPNQKEAAKAAAVWEDELRTGRYAKPSRMPWETFREYYTANALPGLATTTAAAYEGTLDMFHRLCRPEKLADATTQRVTAFVRLLRESGDAEATIAKHLRQLKASMRWAHREGLLSVLPVFNMPKRAKGAKIMRGRPICEEEFERMIKVVPKVVDNAAAPSWQFYLRGLWTSGLRLTESLTLSWDDVPGSIVVDLSGRRPMLRIPAEAQKSNRDETLPITPEFATLLLSVPERDRRGRVFKLLDSGGTRFEATTSAVSHVVSAIGEKAGVVVDQRQKGDKTIRKFASAHDLRRAFAQRWSAKVMPNVLRELMRHASINTTMAYYVGSNVEATADAIWSTSGSVSGSSAPNSQSAAHQKSLET